MDDTGRYTLKELSEETGVAPRTIRFYTTEGLLPPPLTRGRYATYTGEHLRRLRLIREWKHSYLPLATIREHLAILSDPSTEGVVSDAEPPIAVSSTYKPVQTIYPVRAERIVIPSTATEDAAAVTGCVRTIPAPMETPDITPAEGWRRFSVTPGIEIHARAGLAPEAERNLELLVTAARQRLGPAQKRARTAAPHAHPRSFRLVRHIDRGWGELAFEYRWEASDGSRPDEAGEIASLSACMLYEVTTYAGNPGRYEDGWYYPPEPPFAGWQFRDPTDGRTAEVGMECFVATRGQAWDRHKIGGRLLPPAEPVQVTCTAVQTYRFFCEECGAYDVIAGPDGGPHEIVRSFAPSLVPGCWRYTISKHGFSAWLDVDEAGLFVEDSLGLDFGPW